MRLDIQTIYLGKRWNIYIKNKEAYLRIRDILKEYDRDPTFYKDTPFGKKNNLTKLGYLSHEVLFTEPIDLERYLIGVVLYDKKNKVKKIEKHIKKYPKAIMIRYK